MTITGILVLGGPTTNTSFHSITYEIPTTLFPGKKRIKNRNRKKIRN